MKKLIAGGSLLLPLLTFAQFGNIDQTIASLSRIINSIIPLVIGIAVLLFLVGLLRYVTAGADEEAKEAARGMIIYGIIVIFVMVSVWGFVRILSSTIFGQADTTTALPAPRVPTPR